MPRFRATVWLLRSVAEWSDLQRFVVEESARDKSQFEAIIRDRYCLTDVDNQVWFGPISTKPDLPLLNNTRE